MMGRCRLFRRGCLLPNGGWCNGVMEHEGQTALVTIPSAQILHSGTPLLLVLPVELTTAALGKSTLALPPLMLVLWWRRWIRFLAKEMPHVTWQGFGETSCFS